MMADDTRGHYQAARAVPYDSKVIEPAFRTQNDRVELRQDTSPDYVFDRSAKFGNPRLVMRAKRARSI